MKFLLIPALFLSLGLAEQQYGGTFDSQMNDPDTIKTTTIEREEAAPATKNKTGVQSSGISTEDLNTSPNRAPSTDQEVIEGTSLYNEGVSEESIMNEEEMIEAQEAEEEFDASEVIDYSTLPDDSETDLLEPNY